MIRPLAHKCHTFVHYKDYRISRQVETTSGHRHAEIDAAIDSLHAGGSTNGSAGIEMAYQKAMEHFVEGGTNRVILCTDGDLNVGISDDEQLVQFIREKATSNVFLTVLGFGTGNLKDAKLEKLADHGNGIYAYVDSLREARKVLVEQLAGSLVTIAKDVKIQVEFKQPQAFEATSDDFRFAAAVAAFGMQLRGSSYCATTSLEQIERWAFNALGEDHQGRRTELVGMIRRAGELMRAGR
jgi:hypothetical protein